MRPLLVGVAVGSLQLACFATDAAAAALPKDPCALLKPAEIQTLAPNATIGRGILDMAMAPLGVGCKYTWGPKSPQWGESALTITVMDASQSYPGVSPDLIQQGLLAQVKVGGPNASQVSGVGDAAVFTMQQLGYDLTKRRPQVRTVLLLTAAMLATADLRAADERVEDQIEVRLNFYFDQSGDDEPHVIKLGKEPKTFTFKIQESERLLLKMTPLDGCRVSIEILRRENVTTTRPLSWPRFFEPGATFAIGVHYPWHRQEIRGSVSGLDACSRSTG